MTATRGAAAALEGVVAADRLRVPERGGAWAVGGRSPGAVAFPASVDELAALMRRASEEGLSVRAAGAGRWLRGGGSGGDVDVVVSTRRLSKIEEYVPGNLTLTAGAGLTLERLDRTTRESGQWLPLDPPGWPDSTLGAAVATGLPGPLAASYGRPRDHLLGLTLVTGDGRVLEPGGRVVKNVAGFDLVRLAAGSRGALGVVARATVRLFPVPGVDRTLVWRSSDVRELAGPARSAATAPTIPGALELLAPDPGDPGGEGAAMVARLFGSCPTVDEEEGILRDAVGSAPERILEGPDSAGWHRDRAVEEGRWDDGSVELRIALLPSRLSRLLAVIGRVVGVGGEPGRALRRVHLTTGVARLRIEGPGGDQARVTELAEVLGRARAAVGEDGGSLTLTGAPASLLERIPARSDPDPATGELMTGLRREFDPAGILASDLGERGAA